jgi:hypothetical protein
MIRLTEADVEACKQISLIPPLESGGMIHTAATPLVRNISPVSQLGNRQRNHSTSQLGI